MRGWLLPALLIAATAGAQERQPVPFVARPLTLPKLTLSPSLDASYQHVGLGNSLVKIWSLDAEVAFGILDDLTVSARVVPLELSPDLAYGSAQVGGLYRFVRGVAEVGAQLQLAFPAPGGLAEWQLTVGAPLRVHLGRWGRLDGGLAFDFVFVPGRQAVGLALPVAFAVQPWRYLFLSVASGVSIRNLAAASASTDIPLGFQVGGTVPARRGPLVDIAASFTFPYFIDVASLGGGARFAVIYTYWVLDVGARFYFYL